MATLRTPFSTSHRPISRTSAVKHPKRRTGSGSRSGLMATQCSLPPTSIPAASGCTISSAFQSTLFCADRFCLPVGFFLLTISPISIRDCGLGPVPIRKIETFQRGQIRSRNGNEPPNQCQGSDENRGHAQMRVWNASDSTALACRIHFNSDKRVKWHRFLTPETFPPGTVPRSDRTMVDTRTSHPFRLLRFRNRIESAPLLSLFVDHRRTVLPVKGSLRRALRRALDG